MKKLYVSFFGLVLTLVSCSADDNSSKNDVTTPVLLPDYIEEFTLIKNKTPLDVKLGAGYNVEKGVYTESPLQEFTKIESTRGLQSANGKHCFFEIDKQEFVENIELEIHSKSALSEHLNKEVVEEPYYFNKQMRAYVNNMIFENSIILREYYFSSGGDSLVNSPKLKNDVKNYIDNKDQENLLKNYGEYFVESFRKGFVVEFITQYIIDPNHSISRDVIQLNINKKHKNNFDKLNAEEKAAINSIVKSKGIAVKKIIYTSSSHIDFDELTFNDSLKTFLDKLEIDDKEAYSEPMHVKLKNYSFVDFIALNFLRNKELQK